MLYIISYMFIYHIIQIYSYLKSNQLTGPLTGLESDGMGNLEALDLEYNYFNDSIPAAVTDLDELIYLFLGYNYFTGYENVENVFIFIYICVCVDV
jgi:hypothetical protein